MNLPSSTYRVQLHKGFNFKNLLSIIDYLHELGITAIYAAPILKSNPGSMHGYDVVEPHEIDPEIGTIQELRELAAVLKEKNMIWIQDIVPNHMAFSTSNERLMDVLERGRHSLCYDFFDIDWNHPSPELNDKLEVPFLGSELEECIRNQEIKVNFSLKGLTVDYGQSSFPLSLPAYRYIFSRNGSLRSAIPVIERSHLNSWKLKKQLMINSIMMDMSLRNSIEEILLEVNADPEKLKQVLSLQYYSLTFWKRSEQEINYRRFFTVNELICLRMEHKHVFKEYHSYLYSFYIEGLIHGFRIDHIDGLKNPAEYVRRLRKLTGPNCYIIAEKILESKEKIPTEWPLEGTSGYEFLSFVNQLITSREGAKELLQYYNTLIPDLPPYKDMVLQNKRMILENHMGGEWQNLLNYFISLDFTDDFDAARMKKAIALFMIHLPVYRIYPEKLPLTDNEYKIVDQTLQGACTEQSEYKEELDFLRELFLTDELKALQDKALTFLQRVMQFTGPLTAKGVEDTTFYIYNALISHDEVGDSPSRLGISIKKFHEKMLERQRTTPYSLNTTSTHDTKRGEDARLRLNVLSEFPQEWIALVREWLRTNQKYKSTINNELAPSVNDEYYIYQSVVGGFPEDLVVTDEFIKRLQTYQTKVVREAKVYSNWSAPDEAYEKACSDFISGILQEGSDFLTSFIPFMQKLCDRSNIYALSQLLIKLTAPGIPDTYQGCELWDLSFVDPDNRRPVDYEVRRSFLSQIKQKYGKPDMFSFLRENRLKGVEKLFGTWATLNFRRDVNDVFLHGEYKPLSVTGNETVAIAYARFLNEKWVLIVAPLGKRDNDNAMEDELHADYIALPDSSPDQWRNIFTGEIIQTQRKLLLSRCLSQFPVAVLTNVN